MVGFTTSHRAKPCAALTEQTACIEKTYAKGRSFMGYFESQLDEPAEQTVDAS